MTETFTTPTVLYRCTGDYAGFAASERDVYGPQRSPMYWVPLTGGAVTADVLRRLNSNGDPWESEKDGDPWIFDTATGLTMTADEVAAAIKVA